MEELVFMMQTGDTDVYKRQVPILCVYPFIQKYFEKGVMIGAVKG